MIGRAFAGAVALAALCAAMTVAVVAAAFAMFLGLSPALGEAGAAGVVALLFALIVAVVVAIMIGAKGKSGHHASDRDDNPADFDIVGKVFDMARKKPLWAAGAAVAAGLLAVRNPALVATIVAAFMESPKSKR